jgi:hypothetical protein
MVLEILFMAVQGEFGLGPLALPSAFLVPRLVSNPAYC